MLQTPGKSVNQLNIAVLAGGAGSERQVSLLSGQNIHNALLKEGLNAALCDLDPQKLDILDDPDIDLFFLALHGRFGEDGQLQQILEQKHKPFTGSGSKASRLAFDKVAAKKIFAQAGLPVAGQVVLNGSTNQAELAKSLKNLAARFVVKPIREGSSVGIQILDDPLDAAQAAVNCRNAFGDCMVEAFVPGREITVGILETKALPIIEIRTKKQFYDYNAKYLDDATEYLFDTVADAGLAKEIQRLAEKCFNALGCRHLSRVDFILTPDNKPCILEINTLPGFTSHSLLPMAAAYAGIPAEKLCARIACAAWSDFHGGI